MAEELATLPQIVSINFEHGLIKISLFKGNAQCETAYSDDSFMINCL